MFKKMKKLKIVRTKVKNKWRCKEWSRKIIKMQTKKQQNVIGAKIRKDAKVKQNKQITNTQLAQLPQNYRFHYTQNKKHH